MLQFHVPRNIHIDSMPLTSKRQSFVTNFSLTYYVTQKNEILDPSPPLLQIFQENFFSLFDLLQNLRPPSPLKSERNK